MNCVVLGLGISGRAAALFLQKRGWRVTGVDKELSKGGDFPVIAESLSPQLNGVDLLIKSPGIPPSHPWVEAALARGVPVLGEVDLALRELVQKNKTVFGITGSNGKTTTTLMTAHLLSLAGKKAVAAGNVGVPLLSQIESDAEVFVVELSSFQLENIVPLPVLDGAVILNITPNHLDRYPSFGEYVRAKWRIASCLKEGALLWVSRQAVSVSPLFAGKCEILDQVKEKVETILSLSYRDNIYPHDLENVAAAFALSQIPEQILKQGVATFIRPPHRLEYVREISGVTFINDSKATSVDAVIKAIAALKGPIILIAGGVDKGGAFSDWLSCSKGKVARVLALGLAAKRIKSELGHEIAVDEISSLEEGVYLAKKIAPPGGTVLLSPGCSSYDQFRDYQHRGDTFRQIVMGLN